MQLRLIPLLALAALLAAPPADAVNCPRGSLTGAVTHVRDGDTIVFGTMPIRSRTVGSTSRSANVHAELVAAASPAGVTG